MIRDLYKLKQHLSLSSYKNKYGSICKCWSDEIEHSNMKTKWNDDVETIPGTGRLEVKPQVVKCWASASPNCFCQFGAVFSSDTAETTAISDVRFTVADDTCGCPLISGKENNTNSDCSNSLKLLYSVQIYLVNNKIDYTFTIIVIIYYLSVKIESSF